MNHQLERSSAWLLVLVLFPCLACDEDDQGNLTCIPEQIAVCTCGSNETGVKICLSDGSGWSGCECPGDSDAGVDSDSGPDLDIDAYGDTDFDENVVDGNFDKAVCVDIADVDGDGDRDILGAAAVANLIAWWENTEGDGSDWVRHTVAVNFEGAQSVYAADIDGDSDLDVIGAALFGGGIAWWENDAADGSTWTPHPVVNEDFYGAVAVHAADLDQDGDMDLLSAGFSVDDITWWENDLGDGSRWIEHVVDGTFDGAQSVHAADVDADGHMDIVGAAYLSGHLAWWRQPTDGSGSWKKHLVAEELEGAYSVHAGDINGDGAPDLLGAAFESNRIAWWENPLDKDDPWIEHPLSEEFEGAYCVFAADLNGDDALDVLGAAGLANEITWWENINGNGSLWSEHNVAGDFEGASFVRAADLNGDGRPDLVGSAETANRIMWWENDWN